MAQIHIWAAIVYTMSTPAALSMRQWLMGLDAGTSTACPLVLHGFRMLNISLRWALPAHLVGDERQRVHHVDAAVPAAQDARHVCMPGCQRLWSLAPHRQAGTQKHLHSHHWGFRNSRMRIPLTGSAYKGMWPSKW
jgi:hypothetical protein